MKKLLLLSYIASLLFAGILTGHTGSFVLADYGLSVDGETSFPARGDTLPSGANLAVFDTSSGLGTIVISIATPGPHFVSLFVDHDIDQTLNTFFNELAVATGSPAGGQSWEIDEPGYRFGNLLTNFNSGRLDNSNGVLSASTDDVAMALGWSFSLSSTQTAVLQMTLSETVPASGFYLSQTDSASGRTIYFSSALSVRIDDNHPPTITCPTNIVANADPGQCYKAGVTYAVTAADDNSITTIVCAPPSGSQFNVGTTRVICLATDVGGNTNGCTFSVTIRGSPPIIHCVGNLIEECAPPGGRPVYFAMSATSTSPCNTNVTVICTPPSGSVFPLGATAVNCAGTDSAGSRSECSFTVFLVGTNCFGEFSLQKSTCLAGEVHADPLLQPYPCGTCVEITGVPAEGWTFLGWLGDARGLDQTVRLTMTQNKCVQAVFGTRISVGSASNGTAWLDPVAPIYPCGSEVRGLARPNTGYYFNHWTNSLGDTVNPVDFTVAKTNAVVTPVFLPLPAGQASLTVETRGLGTVRGQPSRLLNRYPIGSNVVVRATPDSGQVFLGWTFDSVGTNATVQLTNNPVTVSMNTSRSIIARFTDRPRIEIVRCQGELINGIFRFQVHGRVLQTFIIEASQTLDDPAAWHEVGRATNILGAVQYEDPYLPNMPQRFYRVRVADSECPEATLAARQEGEQVFIEWPATTCDCVLEEASSMTEPVTWTLAPVTLQVVGDKNRAIVSTASRNKFYRLSCTK